MAGQLDTVAQLFQLLGGSRTTGTADTAVLQQVLSQMQQQNSPEGQAAQLQALFQQAAGSIPGLQGAYSNAVGARRGGNSAVQGALNKLMSQVTLAGQAQQNQNLQAQAQAAAALANATRGQSTGTNLGGVVKNLLLAQGLAEGGQEIKKAGGLGKIVSGALGNMFSTAPAEAGLTNTEITQASPLEFNYTPGVGGLDLTGSGNVLNDGFNADSIDLGFDAGASGLSADSGVDFGGGGLLDELTSYGVFADGGLVGRDGHVPAFADGGSVQVNASGARRSTAQSITPSVATALTATNQAAPTAASSPTTAGLSTHVGIGEDAPNPSSYQPNALADTIRSVAANPVARGVLGLALPGVGAVLGLAGLPEDANAERALATVAPTALSIGLSDVLSGLAPAGQLAVNQAVGAALRSAVNTTPATEVAGSANDSEGGYGQSTAPDGGASMGLSMGDVLGSGGYSSAPSSGIGLAHGGEVSGPGTGTSDSIPARLSDGEYVIPADVVEALGVDFFDMLRNALHTPAAQQR